MVAAASGPVGRDEVAAALGVGRTLAAFHLDKLVAAGLLETSYARRSGKTGPGAGRPAKLYRVAASEHAVSVPPRAYRGAAELLAAAVEQAGAEDVLYRVAEREGRRAAASGGEAADPVAERDERQVVAGGGNERQVAVGEGEGRLGRVAAHGAEALGELLTTHGYAPAWDGSDRVVLRNCPFHRLAEQFPPVICGMNLAMVTGLLAGGELAEQWVARMDAAPGRCCVTVSSKTNTD